MLTGKLWKLSKYIHKKNIENTWHKNRIWLFNVWHYLLFPPENPCVDYNPYYK